MSRNHDCYCAICNGPLENLNIHIGERTEQAKRTRKKLIKVGPPGDRDESAWSDISKSEDPNFDVEMSYDPDVLQGYDCSWLDAVICVAWDPELKLASRYYFSTDGRYADCDWELEGARYAEGLGDSHPIPLYYGSFMHNEKNPTRKRGFPLHTHCAQVLARAITGSSDIRDLNPAVLYEMMDQLSAWSRLKLDYGNIQYDQNKHWECNIGEEYSLVSPLWPSGSSIDKDTARSLYHRTKSLNSQRTTKDSFDRLPPELIHCIAESLAAQDLFLLCQASMVVREVTRGSGHWRRIFYNDLSWAVDVLSELADDPQGAAAEAGEDPVDWMKAYMLFRRADADDAWGMEGAFLGLANRKRIWHVCEQIKPLYEARLASGEVIGSEKGTGSG